MKNHSHGAQMLEALQKQGYVLDSLERNYARNPFRDPDSFGRILCSWGLLIINGMKHGFYVLEIPNQTARYILLS